MGKWMPFKVVFRAGYKADAEDANTNFYIPDSRALDSCPLPARLECDLNLGAIPSSRQG